jgi:hypothetical protein
VSEQFDFVTDAELIRRLGLPEKVGRVALRELDKASKARRPFPKPDPLFWPAVKLWFLDYKCPSAARAHRVGEALVPWEEHF